MSRIGFIGAGNMAEALIKGIVASGNYKPEMIAVSDKFHERVEYMAQEYGVTPAVCNTELSQMCDIIVLSVKPQIMPEVLDGLRGIITQNQLIISIAAGIKVFKITDALGDLPVIRVMPNTPSLVGKGASGIYANEKAQSKLDQVKKIFDSVGQTIIVEKEELIDSVTAVSGSGPAYFFLFMEELINAAQVVGLDEDDARKLVLQTALGAATLAVEADKKSETPGDLRRKVTSPGGTTEAALQVFANDQLGATILVAVERAFERSQELSS